MAEWKRSEQLAFLRVLDAVTALLVTPAGRERAGLLVAERLLASAFELLGGEDFHHEAARAGRRLARLTPQDTADEAAARNWLREALRERAQAINAPLWEGERGWIDLREHDAWTLLDLNPFSRRLRIWTATTRANATALGSALGIGPHQIGHWAAGRSRPSDPDRAALAAALGVHPAWLAAERDHSADGDLYLYRACPCGSGAALVPGTAERSAYRGEDAGDVLVLWCSGCGQPHAALGTSALIPLPVTDLTELPAEYPYYRAARVDRGNVLEQAWPHALWCPGPDTVERGRIRVPPLLTVPPFTPAAPAPPAPPPVRRPVRRQPLDGGPVPQAGVERTGVERIQALLLWVGAGRRLTGKGKLKLADARMLVEALPTGDQWDFYYDFPSRTRSSAQLPHLTRLLGWGTESGLLEVTGGLLAPARDCTDVFHDLPALSRTLIAALPRKALCHLNDCWVLSPLSLPEDLARALTVLWRILRDASEPISPTAIADAIWEELTDGEDAAFEDPKGAEAAVRRDVTQLLVLSRDVDLLTDVGDLLQLTATGRQANLPTC